MKRAWILVTLLGTPLGAQQAQLAAPVIPFESVPDFFKLPDHMNFGEVAGVATNSKGHIFVFTRNTGTGAGSAYGQSAAQLLEFGPDGRYLREVAPGLYAFAFAHSVRIDKNDNIWAIDKGSNMVVRLTPAGKVVWVFGRREESTHAGGPEEQTDPPRPAQDGQFRQPTDVAWDSRGNIFITDGYINSRVAKYDMNGDWVKQWGTPGTGESQFRTPHSIAVDSRDNVYVGDRGNQRVQVFDTDGKFLRMFSVTVPPDFNTRAVNGATPASGTRGIGAPNSLCITPGPNQVLFLGESTWPGRIFKLTLDGKVLGVIGRSGRNLGQFSGAHAIACPSENEIYVAETSNWRVQKLLLKPAQQSSQAR